MTKEDLKELVKQHFNLVEAPEVSNVEESVEETFATATLEDGTKVTNDKGAEFAVGDKVFVEVEGEKKPAPAGDHITESGITITLDDESIITGMKRPDEQGEGSEDLAEDKVEEAISEVETEATTESDTEEAFEAKDEEELKEEEKMEAPSMEDMISVIAEVVEEKMAKVEEKMGKLEEEMGAMKDKMNSFASEPAEESTTASNFSSVKKAKLSASEKRYEAMLNKLQTK